MENDHLLSRIKGLIIDKEPDARIFLYGSRARGTSKPDSDWDLLILLNKDKITFEMEKDITYPLFDLEIETGEIISPIIFSQKDWETKYVFSPFYKNIFYEGKLI